MPLKILVLTLVLFALFLNEKSHASSSVSLGLGFFTDYNSASSRTSSNRADLTALTGERVRFDYRFAGDGKGWDFKISDEVSISQYLKDPDLSLTIPETVYHDIRLGYFSEDTTANRFTAGLFLSFRQYAFFSPDNFVDFGVYRMFVPALGFDGHLRLLNIGSQVRLGTRGSLEIMGSASGGQVKVENGYLVKGSLTFERIIDAFVFEANAGASMAYQKANLAEYSRYQNNYNLLLSLFFR